MYVILYVPAVMDAGMPTNANGSSAGVVTVMVGMVAACLSIFPSSRESLDCADASTARSATTAKALTTAVAARVWIGVARPPFEALRISRRRGPGLDWDGNCIILARSEQATAVFWYDQFIYEDEAC